MTTFLLITVTICCIATLTESVKNGPVEIPEYGPFKTAFLNDAFRYVLDVHRSVYLYFAQKDNDHKSLFRSLKNAIGPNVRVARELLKEWNVEPFF